MRNLSYILCFSLLFLTAIGLAQENRSFGLLLDDDGYEQLTPHTPIDKYEDIAIQKNLRNYCPTPKDQGYLPSCVGWSVGYAALTINKMIGLEIDDTNIANNMAHSAAFIFNTLKEGKDCYEGGMTITKALEFLKSTGDCLASSFNNSTVSCQELPEKNIQEEAQAFRISSYARIFEKDASAEKKITTTQQAIAANQPVIVGIKIDPSFVDLKKQKWEPDIVEAMDYHAMVVVGYDQVREEFELMNSFGEEWGDGGFVKISFKDFGQLVRYGCVISFYENALAYRQKVQKGNKINHFTGTLDLAKLQLATNANETILTFSKVYPHFNTEQQIYEIHLPLETTYQLNARKIPRGQYIYAFSLDATNKLELHYSSLQLSQKDILIPSKEKGLRFSVKGTEYLCLLISAAPIENIEERLQRLLATKGHFKDRLQTTLESPLSFSTLIDYSPYLMQFTASDTNSIIPVVLKVTVE